MDNVVELKEEPLTSTVQVDRQLVVSTMNYLASRPYAEVFKLIQAFMPVLEQFKSKGE